MKNSSESFGREMRAEQRLSARAYIVTADEDRTVLYAIQVEETGGYLSWFDGTKERKMAISSSEKEGDSITYVMETGVRYRFAPMTLKTYREHVRDLLLGAPDFETEEALLNALEEAARKAW